MAQLEQLEDVMIDLLKDTYDAESQLVIAIPDVIKAAKFPALKTALRGHFDETKVHLTRLEQAFELLSMAPKTKKCKAMAGLVKECKEAIEEEGKPALVDACIISAARKVEHYEISAYTTLCSYAKHMGHSELESLFLQSLGEEQAADATMGDLVAGDLLMKVLPKGKAMAHQSS